MLIAVPTNHSSEPACNVVPPVTDDKKFCSSWQETSSVFSYTAVFLTGLPGSFCLKQGFSALGNSFMKSDFFYLLLISCYMHSKPYLSTVGTFAQRARARHRSASSSLLSLFLAPPTTAVGSRWQGNTSNWSRYAEGRPVYAKGDPVKVGDPIMVRFFEIFGFIYTLLTGIQDSTIHLIPSHHPLRTYTLYSPYSLSILLSLPSEIIKESFWSSADMKTHPWTLYIITIIHSSVPYLY